jgi:protein DJ-1
MLFSLTIVEILAGAEKRNEVAGPMVVAETL